MNRTARLFLVLSLVPAFVRAQEAPAPAAELARLQVFVGHWQGSGEATMGPGQKSKWSCESTYAWALGKHFLQADTTITFEGQPEPMQFREYMGWDRENGRYVTLAVNNAGEAAVNTSHFVGDDVVVGLMLWTRQGNPEVERARTKFTKDTMTMSITFLGTEGPAVEAVTGTFKRVEKASPRPLEGLHMMMGAPAPEMARIARMAGDFDFAGSMVPMPGMPKMDIKGRSSIRPLFDGAVVHVSTRGEPGYEAEGFYWWNATDRCYGMSHVNNMGQVGSTRCWFVGDDKLVGVASGPTMGVPSADRIALQLDDKGRPKRVVCHRLSGDAEPFQSFAADYAPAKQPAR